MLTTCARGVLCVLTSIDQSLLSTVEIIGGCCRRLPDPSKQAREHLTSGS